MALQYEILQDGTAILLTAPPSLATVIEPGIVQPDGETINITADGIISAIGGGTVNSVDNLFPDPNKNVVTKIFLTKEELDEFEYPEGSGLYPGLANLRAIITDGSETSIDSNLLTSDQIIYVRTDGDDTNEGLTEASAVATLAQAQIIANNLDPGNFKVCIDLGPGEFSTVTWVTQKYGRRRLFIQGAGNELTTLKGSTTIYSSVCMSNLIYTGVLTVFAFVEVFAYDKSNTLKLVGTGSDGTFIGSGALALGSATLEIEGTFDDTLVASRNGSIIGDANTIIRLINIPTFKSFLTVYAGGQANLHGSTIEGEGVGKQYIVTTGGSISWEKDLSLLPGTITGTYTPTAIIGAQIPAATTTERGSVRPDGSTITVAEGVLTTTKLATPRTIEISGAVTGTATPFDGSTNISIPATSVDATKLSGTLPIANGGTGAASSATALTNLGAVTKTGDTMTGTLYVGLPGTNRVRINTNGQVDVSRLAVFQDYDPTVPYSAISFRNVRPDGTVNTYKNHILSYSQKSIASAGTDDDPSFVLNGSGMLFAGSGESALSMRNVLVTGVTEVPEGLRRIWPTAGPYNDSTEHTVISSDNYLHLISNCNTIANARGAYLNFNGQFAPHSAEGQSLGTVEGRWDAFIRNLNVSGTVIGVDIPDWRTSAVTIYVRTDGNDSNTGLSNTAAGAVASWTGVYNVIRSINMRNANVTLSFREGTFAGTTIVGESFTGTGSKTLTITGVAGSTFFSSTLSAYHVRLNISNIEFQSTVSVRENASVNFTAGCIFSGGPLSVYENASVALTSGVFQGASTAATAIASYRGGTVVLSTGVTFSGAFTMGMEAYAGGIITTANTNNIPITLTDASFSTAFMRVGIYGGGEIGIRGTPVITGTATGVRYIISNGGKITGRTKAQLDAFIGDTAGTISGSSLVHSGQFISSGTTASASGYLLADGTDILSPVSTVTALGAVSALTISSTTTPHVRATPGATLAVTVAALAVTSEKLTTLVVQPTAACTLSFVGTVNWTNTALTSITSGSVAVINIWQIGGIVLLSRVYPTE